MMGSEVSDPHAVENPEPTTVPGLGLLDLTTVMEPKKTLRRFSARTRQGDEVTGYEIHMGVTDGPGLAKPMMFLDDVPEGAFSQDEHTLGCYIHGLFTSDSYRTRFLSIFRGGEGVGAECKMYERQIDATLDELAAHIEKYVDVEKLAEIAGL
jgi:adenosylcobyric acid synthase